MHALIIEDEPLVAMSIEDVLRTCGFTSFDLATTVEEALSAAKRSCPDLITADVDLKPGSGLDAVNRICTGPTIPVIFITGSPTDVRKRAGQYRMIEKPFAETALVAEVNIALGRPALSNPVKPISRIDERFYDKARIRQLSER